MYSYEAIRAANNYKPSAENFMHFTQNPNPRSKPEQTIITIKQPQRPPPTQPPPPPPSPPPLPHPLSEMSYLHKHPKHHFFCVVCSLHFPLYSSADAHVLVHHPGQRPNRILDVLELLPDQIGSEIINVARATLARGVLDSAVRARDNHKRGNPAEHAEDQSPTRLSKAPRLLSQAPTGGPGIPRPHGLVRDVCTLPLSVRPSNANLVH